MIPGTVHLGYLHPDEVAAPFHTGILRLIMHDIQTNGRIVRGGYTPSWCGSSRIPQGRNQVVRNFLRSEAEWLFWIDADMAFRPTIVDELVASAEAHDAKILGALAFAYKIDNVDMDYGVPEPRLEPTIYGLAADQTGFIAMADYPDNTVVQCAATGSAAILIHRQVFEDIKAEHGEVWYAQIPWPLPDEPDNMCAEDISFCIRATRLGHLVHIDTGIKTRHAKTTYLSHEMYRQDFTVLEPAEVPTYAVIPVKDRWEMTSDLLDQLADEALAGVFVYDNGSTTETKAELRKQKVAEVFPADGLGIHEMWMAGVDEATERAPICNLLFLNNDISLEPGSVEAMALALRSDPGLAAVCPNYDGRDGQGVTPLHSICANRYDGTGGLAGFAFMVRSEVFRTFSFPLDAMWWYGDNLLTLAIERMGAWYGMVHAAKVEHLDGGGQTGDWDAYVESELHTKDLEAFQRAAAEMGIKVEVGVA